MIEEKHIREKDFTFPPLEMGHLTTCCICGLPITSEMSMMEDPESGKPRHRQEKDCPVIIQEKIHFE